MESQKVQLKSSDNVIFEVPVDILKKQNYYPIYYMKPVKKKKQFF